MRRLLSACMCTSISLCVVMDDMSTTPMLLVCVTLCVCVFICRHPLVHDSRGRQEHGVSRLGERETLKCTGFSLPPLPSLCSLLPFVRLFLCLSLSESTIPELDTFSQNILKTLSEFVPNVSQFLPVSKTV